MSELDAGGLAAQLIGTSGDGALIADPEGTIIYWNQGATGIFGFSPHEAIGSSIDLIIPERLQGRHWEGFATTMRTGKTSYADRLLAVPATHRDGRRLSIEFRVTLLGDDPSQPAAIGAIIRDVTERWEQDRKMRARLASLERTAET